MPSMRRTITKSQLPLSQSIAFRSLCHHDGVLLKGISTALSVWTDMSAFAKCHPEMQTALWVLM